jgi:hypothetical protein
MRFSKGSGENFKTGRKGDVRKEWWAKLDGQVSKSRFRHKDKSQRKAVCSSRFSKSILWFDACLRFLFTVA